MSKCVLVVGIGCSGTSALAGVVHKLGCPMGRHGHLTYHSVSNHPLFEDRCTYGLFTNPRPYGDWVDAFHDFIIKHQRRPLWGFKNTMTINALPWAINHLRAFGDDVCIVASHRRIDKSIDGRKKGKCPPGVYYDLPAATLWGLRATADYYSALATIEEAGIAPIYNVQYEELMDDTAEQVQNVAEFLFSGIDEYSEENLWSAIEHVESFKERH